MGYCGRDRRHNDPPGADGQTRTADRRFTNAHPFVCQRTPPCTTSVSDRAVVRPHSSASASGCSLGYTNGYTRPRRVSTNPSRQPLSTTKARPITRSRSAQVARGQHPFGSRRLTARLRGRRDRRLIRGWQIVLLVKISTSHTDDVTGALLLVYVEVDVQGPVVRAERPGDVGEIRPPPGESLWLT